jgi:CHAT domain-containing protein/tetratricopeptide (TPR) repeat protein
MKINLLRLFFCLSFVVLSAATLHAQSITELNRQVQAFLEQSDYEKALPLAKTTLKRAESELDKADTNYVNALYNLGRVYHGQEKWKQADTLWQQAGNLISTIIGKQSVRYAQVLHDLAKNYKEMGQYKEAEPLLRQALALRTQLVGINHPDYVSSLNDLGVLCTDLNEYTEADSLLSLGLKQQADRFGTSSIQYAIVANSLALLYDNMYRYEQAQALYQQALRAFQQKYGTIHPQCAEVLNNIAVCFYNMGDYSSSEVYRKACMQIMDSFKDKLPTEYAIYMGSLAALYSTMGRAEEAEQLHLLTLKLKEQAMGKNHISYAIALNNIGLFYSEYGLFQKAEPMLHQVPVIIRQVFGETHSRYGFTLNNLAFLYINMKRYTSADSVLSISRNLLKKDSPFYANATNNLAELYLKTNRYTEANALMREAIDIYGKTLGKNHPDYARVLNGLASTYQKLGDTQATKQAFTQALRSYQQSIGTAHPYYMTTQRNLFNFYTQTQGYEQADSIGQNLYQRELSLSQRFNRFLSENENNKAQKRFDMFLIDFTNFYYRHSDRFPNSPGLLFDNALYQKGNQLQNLTQLRQRVAVSQDTSLVNLFDRWTKRKRIVTFYLQNPTQTKYIKLADEEERANQLEKELTQRSQAFKLAGEQNNIRWQDVQKQLKPGEAAVEFIHFPYYNGIDETDTVRYMALVLRPGDAHPKLVQLCDEKPLDSLLHWAGNTPNRLNQLYSPTSAAGRTLYKLIWQPLTPLLNGIRVVYASPSGLLNRVSLRAIPATDGRFLTDHYDLRLRMSLRELANQGTENQSHKKWKAAIYGGIQYEADSLALHQAIRLRPDKTVAYRRSIDSTRGGSWGNLPATLTEAKTIDQLLRANAIRSELRTGWQANEESVKALENGSSPEVIHLATHGFFYPEAAQSDKNAFKSAENPLLRSGLVLAGANRVWRGGKPIDGLEDGILTAYEVANLNLTNTKLVTLSACETALGDIRGAEGVYGLQRAFRLAGVPTLLVSLWRVPDKETARMMQLFYGNFVRGIAVETAFQQAQQVMRQTYSPYNWAAFVLVK